MLTISSDPRMADEQIQAILFYLTTFGYIDGDFDLSEKDFIRDYIAEITPMRVEASGISRSDPDYFDLVRQHERRYNRHFDRIDAQIQEMFDEVVSANEDQNKYVYARLKLRCFEIFKSFDADNQKALLESVDELIAADGIIHPAEMRFRDELTNLLQTTTPSLKGESQIIEPAAKAPVAPSATPYSDEMPRRVAREGLQVNPATTMPVKQDDHPLFQKGEHHYSKDPQQLMQQAANDYRLMMRALDILKEQRGYGIGRLRGKDMLADLATEPESFLDGHVYVLRPQMGRRYELTVVGDLHGCYNCLKATVMQSDFIRKVEAFRRDPRNNPDPKLVFLGDYIDRGIYSYHGVLRGVLELFCAMPHHVYFLRGNHEFYMEKNGKVFSGVAPAEAIAFMLKYWPMHQFQGYRVFFEQMPNMLFFDKTLFVHGGIPRDDTMTPLWQDLSSLNEDKLRFEMLWSDPSEADFIPGDLQAANARFPFGKVQFRNFMYRIGAETLIRGHEKVNEGVEVNYDFDNLKLLTLFSAGGANNNDLPPKSAYRAVTPMALTIGWADGETSMTPWEIDYEAFNGPERNRFQRSEPELD